MGTCWLSIVVLLRTLEIVVSGIQILKYARNECKCFGTKNLRNLSCLYECHVTKIGPGFDSLFETKEAILIVKLSHIF